MKTTLLLTIALLMIPTLASAEVDVIVTDVGMFHQTVRLSDQDAAQVKYWEVGRVSLTDFENYEFDVIKNGSWLDKITNKNTAIFYSGDYIIKVYNRQTNELIRTVTFTSDVKISTGETALIGLGIIILSILSLMGYGWIQNERLVRQRGWRHP